MYKVTKRDCPMFGIGPYVCEFICDTASDISTLPTSISEGTGGKTVYDNQKCASGSIANVAENGAESKQYMLNNQDIWCPYSVASGSSESVLEEAKAYTDSEIADLINGAPTTRDTLKEIADAMAENQTVVEALDAAIGSKADKTAIPTKVSELENDSGYLTEHQNLSEYAKKTEIPTELPANGGNADTLSSKSIDYFMHWRKEIIVNPDDVTDIGIYQWATPTTNATNPIAYGTLIVSNAFGYICQIAIGTDTSVYIRHKTYDQEWSSWRNIANADTLDGLHANEIATNPNLLINPDFRVNQQGKSEYIGTTECWDKWIVNEGWFTVRSSNDDAAIFTCRTPQVNSWVVSQNIPNYKDYIGKTVTFSAYVITGSAKFKLLINDGVDQKAIPMATGRNSVTYRVSDNATQLYCVIATNGQESENEQIGVFSTKLELGTIATTFVPPNPSIEIAKVRAANDDFVNATDKSQIQIPHNVDVPVWIYTNGKRFQRYMTNSVNVGLTNVPNNSTDYVWYWFDGMNIIAREWAAGKHYICDMINGSFSGWREILFKSGGTMTGALVAQSNTDYATPQVRNITMSDSAPSGGSNGQIHLKY